MNNVDQKLEDIFKQLKGCLIPVPHVEKSEKRSLFKILGESFSLCAGAYHHLNAFQRNIGDLYDKEFFSKVHSESWTIFENTQTYSDFSNGYKQNPKIIGKELRSMATADAAFRLVAAGASICDVVNTIEKDEIKNEIVDDFWPYQQLYKKKGIKIKADDWDRSEIWAIYKNGEKLQQFAFMIALRDEYGHSEFSHENASGFQGNRQTIIEDPNFCNEIIESELEFLKAILTVIEKLVRLHNKGIIDLSKHSITEDEYQTPLKSNKG